MKKKERKKWILNNESLLRVVPNFTSVRICHYVKLIFIDQGMRITIGVSLKENKIAKGCGKEFFKVY